MKKMLIAAVAASSLIPLSLSARTLWCEQCEPQPEECDEHLFVERSQLFIHGEFLYWTVDTGLLDYAVDINQTSPAANTFAIGKYKLAELDWCPGFRVAASYYRCPRYWELTGQYTWLHNTGSSTVSAPVNSTKAIVTATPIAIASGSSEFDLQLGDLYAARIFDPNPHLRMRVYAGGTGGWMRNKLEARYTNFLNDTDYIKSEWQFWGGGLRLGVAADWFWGCQFYLTGRASFATLVGNYENCVHHTNGSTSILVGDAEYKDTRLVFNPQILLGPSWQMPCDCWSVELFAGYELNMWFNVQERIDTPLGAQNATKTTVVQNSALGIHGLTVRLTVGF